ncbi:acyl-CoA dehydrogenase [Steroidobacter denitrificans]|uniref:Acyl-CoA dehydrogenase n=1 Tax=Steroidobacter denitrificans TaxID=465721 RepID=A0A127FB99_STEDE|nr:acyl-CoA dehydrogenase family protein [Steroidobacter denitrificans]AMN47687.1 acyl-CoA dehydrogenase [Steroidobacter denitrificans]
MYFTNEPEHIGVLRTTIHRFIEAELPRDKARRLDREKTFDRDSFRRLTELGICGLTVSEHFGGNRDLVAAVMVIEELCRRGTSLAGPFIHCAFYGALNIEHNGSEQQKEELLPRLLRGELMFSYGLSEPDVGGDLASVGTQARREGDEIVINGVKRWCTGARFADYIYCLTRSDPEAPRYRNLSFILVPTSAPGIVVTDIEHIGLRYAETCDVVLENVRVPAANIVGGEVGWNNGWGMLAGPALDIEKIEVAACALGIASAALEDAWQYSQERRQFGKAICGHQAVRHSLADLRTKLHACRLMLYHAAWLADSGRACTVETSMAKLFITETALEAAIASQRIMGAYGCAEEYDMERHVRDLLVMPIIGGSSDMQRNNIANRLGLPTR